MSKLTEAARHESCIRCGRDDGTVVAAHINGPIAHWLGRGMSKKPHDLFCAHLCFRCHDDMDGRSNRDPDNKQREWAELVLRTQRRLIDKGVIK